MKNISINNTFKKAFLACFLVLFAAIFSCGKKSSFDESPATIPSSNNSAFDTVAKGIRQTVKKLEYPDEVGQDLVKMVSSWKCDIWKNQLDKAKWDYKDKKITADQVSQVEENIIDELYQTIRKDISYDKEFAYYDMAKIVKEKKAYCFGVTQLFYIIGYSIGMEVEFIDVLELANVSSLKGAHVACFFNLSNGKVIMVDLAYSFVSESFVFKEEYDEVGNYWEIKNKNNHLGIHSKIQIWDINGIIAAIYVFQGTECDNSENYTESISKYTKAIELNPRCAEIYCFRGHAYNKLSKNTEAIFDYTKAIELNPKNENAYSWRAFTYYELGQYINAIADNTKVIELDQNNANAYYSRGLANQQLDRYTEAVSDYSKAIELNPKSSYAYYGRGHLYFLSDKQTKAIYDLTKAIKLDPRNVDAYICRGYANAILGRTDEAKKDLQKVLELDSTLKEKVKEISDEFKLDL
jgi:tetratricopeptide (TPR) repeat protein